MVPPHHQGVSTFWSSKTLEVSELLETKKLRSRYSPSHALPCSGGRRSPGRGEGEEAALGQAPCWSIPEVAPCSPRTATTILPTSP